MADLHITQVRSLIGSKQDQRATVRSLGLRRIRHTVTQPDRPEIRGMVAKVAHLVEVRYAESQDGGEQAADAVLDLQPGQMPHGPGNPPAGGSVADEEAAEHAAATAEAVAAPGAVDNLGDLVENPPSLTSTDPPDAPKRAGTPSSPEDVVDPQTGPQGDQ